MIDPHLVQLIQPCDNIGDHVQPISAKSFVPVQVVL